MTEQSAEQIQAEGQALFAAGRRDEALVVFQEAASRFAATGDQGGRGEALNNIGVIQRMSGRLSQAVAALEEAIVIFGEAGDAQRKAMAQANLGDALAQQGAFEQAAAAYQTAADGLGEIGDGDRQAQVLRAYSLMQLRRRWWLPALDLMVRSLAARRRRSVGQQLLYWFLRLARDFISGQR